MSNGNVNARLVVVFTIGFLAGIAVACGFARWVEVVKKAEQGVHRLTADITPEALYAFRTSPNGVPPLIGVIKAGSEYHVEMRKGFVSYISFRTVVDTSDLQAVSGPLVVVSQMPSPER